MKVLEEKLEDFLWDDSLIHDDILAESYGFRHGFKTALEWILTQQCNVFIAGPVIFPGIIEEELND